MAVHVHLAKFSIRKLAIAMQAEVRLRQKERRSKFRKKNVMKFVFLMHFVA